MQRVTPVVGIFLEVYVVNGTENMSSFNYVRPQEQSIVVLLSEYHCQLRIVMSCKGSNFLR